MHGQADAAILWVVGVDPFFVASHDSMQKKILPILPSEQLFDVSWLEVINDTTRFALSIDVSLYKPEELRVHLTGRDLIIEGNQEKPGGAGYIQRSFLRRWTLPDEVDLDAIDISLNEFGCLSVDAAKTGLHMMRRELPIRIYSRSEEEKTVLA
ncbi:Hsp20/alpha crystallin family protein [Necator americanus]|uniref:Hsp20/alpha crystallin family protein n=1 Tax=Necator americanus TaxID=51031 RepID=W2T4Z8_NECAM|nr:Hsp20/alpha crystallin family protein [Necator americanus]ETN76042.1 Hsp20/alpha crystallin family protein [Necator americanus]